MDLTLFSFQLQFNNIMFEDKVIDKYSDLEGQDSLIAKDVAITEFTINNKRNSKQMKQNNQAEIIKMIQQLHYLQQEHDVSRQQGCRVDFAGDASQTSSFERSNILQMQQKLAETETALSMRANSPIITHMHKINKVDKLPISPKKTEECHQIKQSGDRLGELCRKSAESKWDSHNKNNSIVSNNEKSQMSELKDQVGKLKSLNDKLFSDNKLLMHECIRLRKSMASLGETEKGSYDQIVLMHEINKLKTENSSLRVQMNYGRSIEVGLRREGELQKQMFREQMMKLVQQINDDNEKIKLKLEEIDFRASTRNYSGMKNSNGFTFSTNESKYSEQELTNRDMINSICKIKRQNQQVYESCAPLNKKQRHFGNHSPDRNNKF